MNCVVDFDELTSAMVLHQQKTKFLLTLELIRLKAHPVFDALEEYYSQDKTEKWTNSIFAEDITYDYRTKYLHNNIFYRAIDEEDDALLVWYKCLTRNAIPEEYQDFKMNSVDYKQPHINMMEELNNSYQHMKDNYPKLVPEDYTAVWSMKGGEYTTPQGISWRCDFGRARSIIRLSYDNYRYTHNVKDENPIYLNRRYEVMYVRFILYLHLNKPGWAGNIDVYTPNHFHERPYMSEYNRIKSAVVSNLGFSIEAGQVYNNTYNTGLKPISKAGFKRLCVERELIMVWKAGQVKKNPITNEPDN